VEANSTLVLHLAGADGLPDSGMLAVAIVITTSEPTGETSIRVGSSSATPVLVTSTGTTSAFVIAPVSSGDLQLLNGANATRLTIDVVGWFSSVSEPGTEGLFRPLAGREIATTTIDPGTAQTISISGEQDIPVSGASAVMVHIRVAPGGSGTLAVGPNDAGADDYVTEAYGDHPNDDLGIVKIGAGGSVVVRNTGASSATVSLDAVGWFTDGQDPDGFGDRLSVATPFEALSAAEVGAGGTFVTVCDKNGIPAEESSRPPSLVLARGLINSAGTSTTLLAYAAGATLSGPTALVVGENAARAGQLLLAPGSTCETLLATTTGAATVTAEPYAWFSGGLIISDRARVLAGATLSAITAMTDTSVTFTGASVPNLQVGDIIAAGISTMTPNGLLRRVTGVSLTPETLVVTTENALLGDAVQQGSLSVGRNETVREVALAPPRAGVSPMLASVSSPTSASVRMASLSSCDVTGSLMESSATVMCSASFGNGVWSATVNASAGIALTLGLDIHWGLPPRVRVRTTLGVSAATGGTATATGISTVDETYDMGTRRLKPIEFQLGPVPVVIVPELAAALHTTGTLQATFSTMAEMHAGASVSFDSDTGFTPTHSLGGDGSASYNATLEANIKTAFEPTAKALLYGLDGSDISVGLSPYVEVTADSCTIIGHAGVDLTFGISLGITAATSKSHDFTLPVVDTNLFTIPWRNCAVWSGTMTFRQNDHYKDNRGRSVEDTNWSDNVTIAPPTDGVPPPDGFYEATGSGSGALTAYNYVCDPRLPPSNVPPALELPFTSAYTWGGDMLTEQGAYFSTSDGFTVMDNPPHTGTIIGSGTLDSPGCGHDDGLEWTHSVSFSPFYALVDPATGAFKFATPTGQSDFTGAYELETPQENGGVVHMWFTYALHRTCTQGGNDC
jgi:hypothetical protein